MRLITRPPRRHHPAQDEVDAFEAVIASDPRVQPASWRHPVARAGFWAASALVKLGGVRTLQAVPVWHGRRPDRAVLAVLMGPQFAKCLPHFAQPATKAVYLFDAWPAEWDRIAAFADHFGVDHVFVSASQAAAQLQQRTRAAVHWLPEGIDPSAYRHRPTSERDIAVLQMGRRYDAYHEQIIGALARSGLSYRYEAVKGEIIFPTKADLIDGLSRSRISICVPSSITHPERSGEVETMTLRYLQSMASRCLVVGHAPAEMVRLFGYNPVVEIDAADPAGQLLNLAAAPERHADLIERNHRAVLEAHTWHHRWSRMAEVILGE